MKTYWDLSEQERAALTGEEVERFGDAELMTKGVLKVTPPVLEVAPPTPEPDLDVFVVSHTGSRIDVSFSSAEDARAFVALSPLVRKYHFHSGEFIYYSAPVEAGEWKISAERDHSQNVANLRKSEFIAAKDVKARNETLTREYNEALKAQQDALASMWADWRECCLKASRMAKIADTLGSYQRIADGDANIAFRFLRRVFTDPQIADAVTWGAIAFPSMFRLRRGYADLIDDLGETVEAPPAPVIEAPPESPLEMAF